MGGLTLSPANACNPQPDQEEKEEHREIEKFQYLEQKKLFR